jgi:Golgi SNAP receptor complex protein 2
MESLYQKANRSLLEVQSQISSLGPLSPPQLEQEISDKLEELFSDIQRLEQMVAKEPPSRKQSAKLRVEQLSYDCQHLHSTLKIFQHKQRVKEQEEHNRNELLSRRFTTNDPDTSIMIDHALQHNQSLQNANRGLDDILASGRNIIGGLRGQGDTLKGVQRRIIDIGNTLGLSNTVIRLINRRSVQDKWIVFGGMVVTCVIMYLVVRYLT